MKVEKATRADLADILGWLELEFHRDGRQGFWCNRGIIQRAIEDEILWVIRDNGQAVAFQVGEHSADIANVRKDKQRQGYGSALLDASLARAMRDDVNLLRVECYPHTSLASWEKHGFQRYGNLSSGGNVKARRVIGREFDIPAGLPRAELTVGFYPEAAIHRQGVAPIALHRVAGGRHHDRRGVAGEARDCSER